jgi:DNA transposition AAA+ family ATPase
MLSTQQKLKIIEAIKAQKPNYQNYLRQARALSINPAQLSRIMKDEPELEGVISEARWIAIALKCDVALNEQANFETARTKVFNFIWKQLEFAQHHSVSGILCDRADIGKTHTAMMYARENRNVAYIDCGRNKSKLQFIKAISKEFGLPENGSYQELFEILVFYLKTSDKPLIILDEFGDLRYPTYLEFKALWNATDKHCGWYAMGADGLKKKLDRQISYKKVGFAEIFSRLGNKYQRITPMNDREFAAFQKKQIAQIGVANKCADVQRLHAKTNMSLRRIPIQIGLERTLNETANANAKETEQADNNSRPVQKEVQRT